jgi:hypothetical protein
MSWAEFWARSQATDAAIDAYTAGLPLWVNVWRGWMFFIFTVGIVFVLWKKEARWLALTMIVSIFAYNVVSMVAGVGRFPSIAFVLFWTPLALYLLGRRPQLATARTFDRLYRGWVGLALATLCVSIMFDVYNVAYSIVAGVP